MIHTGAAVCSTLLMVRARVCACVHGQRAAREMGAHASKSTGISSSRVVECEHVPNPYDTAG